MTTSVLLVVSMLGQVSDEPLGTEIVLPKVAPVVPRLVAKLPPGPARENSGIVKGMRGDDVFWIHNDSGDEPRLYAIHRDGSSYYDEDDDTPGVLIGGAINVDWEDITIDADGHLIVGDVGNNPNDRRDLVLYYVDEPGPRASRTTVKKKVFFRYPDQTQFPAPRSDFDFDCEGIFTVGNTVYLLSKNRSDPYMKLYCLRGPKPDVTNVLEYQGRFDIKGQAVGADASRDGLRLVVVTYNGIWLFTRGDLDEAFFTGEIRWLPYKAQQVEAVCFADDETLLLADEAAATLHEVKLADLRLLRGAE